MHSGLHPTTARSLLRGLILLLALLVGGGRTARADAVNECTQAALEAAVAAGGTVTFNCDGTITLTNEITIASSVTLDASGRQIILSAAGDSIGARVTNITTSGSGTNATSVTNITTVNTFTNFTRLFNVSTNASLTLLNLTLANGHHTNGGGIYVHPRGSLILDRCLLSNNLAFSASGAAGANGRARSTVADRGGGGVSARAVAGGAIYNLGSTIITRCAFVTNSAFGGDGGKGGNGGVGGVNGGSGGYGGNGGGAQGGAIYNKGSLKASLTTFQFNQASGGDAGNGGSAGAGIYPGRPGQGGAGGGASGGAVFNLRSAEFSACTFTLNTTSGGSSAAASRNSLTGSAGRSGPNAAGGALSNHGTNAALVNCTFFANQVAGGDGGDGGASDVQGGNGGAGGSGWGGNVFNARRLAATNCTFYDGSADGGESGNGGAALHSGRAGRRGTRRGGNIANSNGVFTLKNSLIILALPPATNASGRFTDAGYNLSSDRSIVFKRGSGSMANTNPMIGSFGRNGGATETLPLLTNSPAINNGDPNSANCPATDQRGITRTNFARCDIGAYEYGLTLRPPVIVASPASQTARTGARATFTVVAQSDPGVTYQWRHSGTTITDATSETYLISSVISSSAGTYDVVVGNFAGSVTSAVATLTIINPVTITQGPASLSVDEGGSARFNVTASGDGQLSYQWVFNNTNFLLGATLSSVTLPGVTTLDAGEYRVIVRNSFSSVTSAPALLMVATNPPSIVTGPADRMVFSGETATFSVTAAGSQPLSYQWFFEGQPITGATAATLVLTNAQPADAGEYFVRVSNIIDTTNSAPATLSVDTSPPVIESQSLGQDVTRGTNLTLAVEVNGSRPLTFQWMFNGEPLEGATGASLSFTNITYAASGDYQLVVTNEFSDEFGTISDVITLTVVAAITVTCTTVEDPANCVIDFRNENGVEFFLQYFDDSVGDWVDLDGPLSAPFPDNADLSFSDETNGGLTDRIYRVVGVFVEELVDPEDP